LPSNLPTLETYLEYVKKPAAMASRACAADDLDQARELEFPRPVMPDAEIKEP
jgi:hypothetical protein